MYMFSSVSRNTVDRHPIILIFVTETQVLEVQRTPALNMSFLINLTSFVQVGECLPN